MLIHRPKKRVCLHITAKKHVSPIELEEIYECSTEGETNNA